MTDWQKFVDNNGDFEFPNYLHALIKDLMKEALDLGTLLSNNPAKLRAYKEQIKKTFTRQWIETAKACEFFDLVEPCICASNEFCEICGGSRYILNKALNPDQMIEIGAVYSESAGSDIERKLAEGLAQVQEDVATGKIKWKNQTI